MSTVKVRMKYQVTIPEEIRRHIPLDIGSRVDVTARGDEIVIRPVVEVPREDAWFWTPEHQQAERRADEEKTSGRFKRFRSVDEAVQWLKS